VYVPESKERKTLKTRKSLPLYIIDRLPRKKLDFSILKQSLLVWAITKPLPKI
jgi:hypothetical protein